MHLIISPYHHLYLVWKLSPICSFWFGATDVVFVPTFLKKPLQHAPQSSSILIYTTVSLCKYYNDMNSEFICKKLQVFKNLFGLVCEFTIVYRKCK